MDKRGPITIEQAGIERQESRSWDWKSFVRSNRTTLVVVVSVLLSSFITYSYSSSREDVSNIIRLNGELGKEVKKIQLAPSIETSRIEALIQTNANQDKEIRELKARLDKLDIYGLSR